MLKIFYFLAAFVNSGLSVFGIRNTYDQPSYRKVQELEPDIELRAYAPRTVVQTTIVDTKDGEAFARLFGYIAGDNKSGTAISMTVPVEVGFQGEVVSPADMSAGTQVMRFYLSPDLVSAGAPTPTDDHVRIVNMPAVTMGVIRYSGSMSQASRERQTERLRVALAKASLKVQGAPLYLAYDPPFAIPFLRRNEVAFHVVGRSHPQRYPTLRAYSYAVHVALYKH